MNNMVIGLTGQTGAGKTTVSDYLRENGVTVIDADQVARRVVERADGTLSVVSRPGRGSTFTVVLPIS